MKIVVIGAGAMGASYGVHLARAGQDVMLVDSWKEHVDAINEDGLHADGALGDYRQQIPALTEPPEGLNADLAIIFVDANNTRAAAETAKYALAPNGIAITCQNGIGNVEIIEDVLGGARVLGGSSMCSAACQGPGHVTLTHLDETSIGEIDGVERTRTKELAKAFDQAGLPTSIVPDVMAKIWQKFIVNCAFNALCATTGLRTGEMMHVPELDVLQDRILDEIRAVTTAKSIVLPDPEIMTRLKIDGRKRMNKPSMLQHVTMGRKTEIDAINGALIREAKKLGIQTPYNEALVALLKGREQSQRRAIHEPDFDYDAWEARIAAGDE
ncbi:MAG: ketopantoate reductase family protein [Geminicoccaceae bacterium]